jgi:hypothetical protein
LFLQILRAGGDDDAAITAECSGNCRNEISERLAGACARLDYEVPFSLRKRASPPAPSQSGPVDTHTQDAPSRSVHPDQKLQA